MWIKITVILIAALFSQILYSQVNTQWITRFNNASNGNESPTCMTTDTEGNMYIAGFTINPSSDHDYFTIKYNPSGEELWKATFNGSGNKADQVNGIAVDLEGNVYVTGSATNENELLDIVTVKYDAKGEQIWVSKFNGPDNGNDGGVGIVTDRENNVYITAYCAGNEESVDIYTMKLNSADGSKVWTSVFNNPIKDVDYPTAIAIDGDNNIFVTGYSHYTSAGNDYITIKYTLNGAQLWAKPYGGKSDDKASALAIDGAGNVYVTGYSGGDYGTVKYSSSGELLWDAKYNGTGNGFDQANAISVDAYGNVYVTGQSAGNGTGFDFATIKYNPIGVELWNSRFNDQGNSNDIAASICTDVMGSVYVTGNTYNGSNDDYTTIKYNPLGNELWIARYNGPGNQVDKGIAMFVDGKGNVFVTGMSIGTSTQYDIATIKYSQGGPEAIPQLVSPAFGSSGIGQNPQLEWTTVKNADFCRLQVALDKNFNTVVVDTLVSIVSGLCKVKEGVLENNTQYFWRTGAVNVAGAGQWSASWTFSVLNAPDSPQLLSPVNGAAGQSVTPTLIWQKSNTAESYRLQISRDITFSDILHDINGLTTNEYTLPGGLLANNAQYFWRVNASNAGGTVPWSNTWSLGTGFVNPPQQPVLISLPTGALGQSLTPTLDWSDQPSVTSYRIQVASDLNFTNIVVDEGNLTSSNYTIPPGKLSGSTMYYWKISANNLGGTGNWSMIWTFTTMGSGLTRVGKDIPKEIMLYNNNPDPFSTTTTIRFDIPSSLDNNQVSVSVFDEMGKEVSKIIDEKLRSGSWSVQWDGSNFPRGYYLYQIRAKGLVQTKKMFLVK